MKRAYMTKFNTVNEIEQKLLEALILDLDDDAWVAPSTLKLCIKQFQMQPSIGVAACRVLPPEEEPLGEAEKRYTYFFSGGACAIRKEVLNKIGYFPSDFFRQAEEGDLALRTLEAKYSILYYPDAVVYHEQAPIKRRNKLSMFYGCRNELYTIARRYPLPLVPAALCWKILIWNWSGIKNCAPHFTLAAAFIALLRLPGLVLQRRPVSLSTIKKICQLRKSRTSVSRR